MLFPQDSLFQEIFTSFDKKDWDKVRKLIVKVDENKIPLKTKNDSIQFSVYNIVKYYTVFDSKKNDSNPNYESNYRFHLNYLSDNGLENYMPAHYINYSKLNFLNEKVKKKINVKVTIIMKLNFI